MIKVILKEVLENRNWSQSKLSIKSSIRPSTISAICKDTAKDITIKHIDCICKALKCNFTDILEQTRDDD